MVKKFPLEWYFGFGTLLRVAKIAPRRMEDLPQNLLSITHNFWLSGTRDGCRSGGRVLATGRYCPVGHRKFWPSIDQVERA